MQCNIFAYDSNTLDRGRWRDGREKQETEGEGEGRVVGDRGKNTDINTHSDRVTKTLAGRDRRQT